MSLDRFNDANVEELRPVLLSLTASPLWADALLDGRPFASLDDLLEASDVIVRGLPEAEVDKALAEHPRIGERKAGDDPADAARSAREQAGMQGADEETQIAIARGNVDYEAAFGRIYLVAAAGRSATELLEILQSRLANDPETELSVVRDQLAKITRLRLTTTFGGIE